MEGSLHPIEWGMIFVFITAVLLWGLRMHKGTGTMEGAFLAGRKVPGVIASFSTVATNLNANDFLGLTGAVYATGLIMTHVVLTNSVVLIIIALVLIHRLRALNVYSLGGWLQKRYSPAVGYAYSMIWVFVWMLFNLGLYIYGGALVLNTLIGWDIYWSIVLLSVVAAIYTLAGGMGAVVATDVLQIALMFFPLLIVSGAALYDVGGIDGILARLPETQRHMATLWPAQSEFGALPIALAGMLFMSLSYWSCEAQILQRPLSAKDPDNAVTTYMGAAIWYAVLVPFVIMLPAMCALVLFPGLENNDHAMPMLITTYLPPGLYGVAVVGLIAGFLSSADSQINAFCTMFTADIYRGLISKNRTDTHYVKVSRIAGVIFTLAAIGTAVLVSRASEGMFLFAISVLATIMPPFGAITMLGALLPRMNHNGAIAGLIGGGAIAIGLVLLGNYGWLEHIASNDLYFRTMVTFFATGLIAYVVSLIVPVRSVAGEVLAEEALWRITPRVGRTAAAVILVTLCMYALYTWLFGFEGSSTL